jgi:hypothetical protein
MASEDVGPLPQQQKTQLRRDVWQVAGAIELGLVIAEGLGFSMFGASLPVGGGHLAQIGVVFGVSFVALELGAIIYIAVDTVRPYLMRIRDKT